MYDVFTEFNKRNQLPIINATVIEKEWDKNDNPELIIKNEILDDVKYLRNLTKLELITVALSLEYCGGEKAGKYLFNDS